MFDLHFSVSKSISVVSKSGISSFMLFILFFLPIAREGKRESTGSRIEGDSLSAENKQFRRK